MRWLAGCVAVVAAAFFAGAGSGEALDATGWGVGSGRDGVPVGDPFAFGVPLEAARGRTVHILDAAVLGVPDGVRALGVFAVSRTETGSDRALIGIADGPWLQANYPSLHLHPVTDAVVNGSLGDWYLLAEVEATRPGHYVTTGVRVSYEVDGAFGEQVMPFVVTLDATVPALAAAR